VAERRMLSKIISVSERVNQLPDIFHMLLFTWMIPHSDDFGRLPGSPMKIKALVVPMLDKSAGDVAAALQAMHDSGLIVWYEVDGEKYIQINNFEAHQTGLHKRTRSKFPPVPGTSGNFSEIPSEQNRTELNRTERKGTEDEQKGEGQQHQQENPFDFYENNIGRLSPKIREEINRWMDDFPTDVIVEAMNQAIVNNKASWGYANSCLTTWFNKGAKTLADVKVLQVEFERNKGGKSHAGDGRGSKATAREGGASPFDNFQATTKRFLNYEPEEGEDDDLF